MDVGATCVPQRLRRPARWRWAIARGRQPVQDRQHLECARAGRRAVRIVAERVGPLGVHASYTLLETEILAVDRTTIAPPPFKVGDPLIRRPKDQASSRRCTTVGRVDGVLRRGRPRRDARHRAELRHLRRPVPLQGLCRGQRGGVTVRVHREVDVFAARAQPVRPLLRGSAGFPALGRSAIRRGSVCCSADNVSFAIAIASGVVPVLHDVTLAVPDGAARRHPGTERIRQDDALNSLAGLLTAAHGRVSLRGHDLARMARSAVACTSSRSCRRRRIQRSSIPRSRWCSWAGIRISAAFAHRRAGRPALVRDAMAATGTTALERRAFDTLSGGEKQRVVIAAALAQAARILLLDEPTASLDLAYQLDVAALVVRLNRERGVTIVLSTHDLNFAASVCRSLLLLREGRVLDAGPTERVLTAANIRAVYGVEADIAVARARGPSDRGADSRDWSAAVTTRCRRGARDVAAGTAASGRRHRGLRRPSHRQLPRGSTRRQHVDQSPARIRSARCRLPTTSTRRSSSSRGFHECWRPSSSAQASPLPVSSSRRCSGIRWRRRLRSVCLPAPRSARCSR